MDKYLPLTRYKSYIAAAITPSNAKGKSKVWDQHWSKKSNLSPAKSLIEAHRNMMGSFIRQKIQCQTGYLETSVSNLYSPNEIRLSVD